MRAASCGLCFQWPASLTCVLHWNFDFSEHVRKRWGVQAPLPAARACRATAGQRAFVCAGAGTDLVLPILQGLISVSGVKAHARALCRHTGSKAAQQEAYLCCGHSKWPKTQQACYQFIASLARVFFQRKLVLWRVLYSTGYIKCWYKPLGKRSSSLFHHICACLITQVKISLCAQACRDICDLMVLVKSSGSSTGRVAQGVLFLWQCCEAVSWLILLL